MLVLFVVNVYSRQFTIDNNWTFTKVTCVDINNIYMLLVSFKLHIISV